MEEFPRHNWVQAMGGLAFAVWLEAQMKANSAEVRRLWRQREEDQSAARGARDTTNRLLDEMRQGIKTPLARRE